MGFEDVENSERCSTRDLEEALVSKGFLKEAVVSEDMTPESLKENEERERGDKIDWNRVRGAHADQRSGQLYGFDRRGDDSDSD